MTSTTLPATVTFARAELAVIYHDGLPHLSARDLALALGYKDTSAVTRIYQRNTREFTDTMSSTVKLTVNRGSSSLRKDVRIFSPRGCHLVAMFANTPLAAAFRRWVLDVLEGLATPSHAPAADLAQDALQLAIHLMQASADTTTSRILYCPGTGSVQAVPNDAFVLSHDRYAQSIENGDVFPTDDQLFALINAAASAVHRRIKFRHDNAARKNAKATGLSTLKEIKA